MLKTYLHFCLGFHITDAQHEEKAVAEIQRAALRLTETLPWLAAKVVHQGRTSPEAGTDTEAAKSRSSGLFSMAPCPEFEKTIVRKVKNCKSLCPSYAEILESKACLKMLDGNVLAPRTAFPLTYDETDDEPAPVVAVQVNMVDGGLLLNWTCQHNVMDAAGLCQIMRLFSFVLAEPDKPLPASAIDWATRSRKDLIPLLGPDEEHLEHAHLRRPSIHKSPPAAFFQQFEWCDWRVSAASLKRIKALASRPEEFANPTSTSVKYVSTNDALTAFCWQRIAAARLQLGRPGHVTCKLARAMDARSIMDVSHEYTGHMIYIAASFVPLETLASASLAYVSSVLRQNLNEAASRHEVRSFATLIANTADKSTIAFAGAFRPDLDVGTSSGLAMQYRFDYGVLGVPDFMNRPKFTPLPSTIYIMPLAQDGDADVQLSLKPDEMRILKEDKIWNQYVRVHPQ